VADVVYMISDMLFSSKLREAAKATRRVGAGGARRGGLGRGGAQAKLAIVDLRLPVALQALAALAAEPAPSVRTVASSITSART
jgi:hypothetical protein